MNRRNPGKNERKMEVKIEREKGGKIQFSHIGRVVVTASSHWRLFQVQMA